MSCRGEREDSTFCKHISLSLVENLKGSIHPFDPVMRNVAGNGSLNVFMNSSKSVSGTIFWAWKGKRSCYFTIYTDVDTNGHYDQRW